MNYSNLYKIVEKPFAETNFKDRMLLEDAVCLLNLQEYFEMGYDGICRLDVFESVAHPSDYKYMKARMEEIETHNHSDLKAIEALGQLFGSMFSTEITLEGSSNPIAERSYQHSRSICKNAMDNYGSQFEDVLNDVETFIKEFKAKYI